MYVHDSLFICLANMLCSVCVEEISTLWIILITETRVLLNTSIEWVNFDTGASIANLKMGLMWVFVNKVYM